jgi:hypothetical protein
MLAACLLGAGVAAAVQRAPGSDVARNVAAPTNPVVITRGLLNAVDGKAMTIVMNGATYGIDPETRMFREEKGGRLTPIGPAELNPGRQVTVQMQTMRKGVRIIEIVQ